MKLRVLPSGMLSTNGYLLLEPSRGEAVLVDAPEGVWPTVNAILEGEKCRLTELWLTHGHWDHIEDAAKIVRETGARVRAHADDKVFYETPEVMASFFYWVQEFEPVKVDHWVVQGEKFEALGAEIEVRHVPGHAPGNVAFYVAALESVFVGDTLFAGGLGRTDLPGGSHEVLSAGIRAQLYTLPDKTAVYPGHGPATTVGAEKRGNPYVA